MSRNRFAKASAIGTVSLGLLAASLGAGCGSSGPSASGPANSPEKASIVQQGQWAVGGCGATGKFTITSPQTINFIAINANAFNNAQFQLQAVTSDNKTIQVNNQIQHADSLLQQVINNSVTTFNLNKTSFDQSAKQDTSQSTSATNDVTEIAKANQMNSGFATTITNTNTVAFQQSSANQWANASQSATNKANANSDTDAVNSSSAGNNADTSQSANAANSAKADNSASQNANQNAFGNNFAQSLNNSLVPVAAGAVAAFPLFNNTLSNSFFNNGANTSAMAANASSANNVSSNSANTKANNFQFANNASDLNNNSHVDNSTTANTSSASHSDNQNLAVNSTHLDTTTQFENQAEADSTRILKQDSMTSAMTSADTSASGDTSALAKTANASLSNATNITNTNSNAFVFANLEQFNSNTFQLTTNLTQSQVNAVLQLFQGNQSDVVSNAAAFPVVTPTCM
jgi:hypothetical protein